MPSSALYDDLIKNQKNGFLEFKIHKILCKTHNLSFYEIEEFSLKNGIIPLRYKRNSNTIDSTKQLKLLQSKVAIIGCGGLGGHVSELLARVGVGNLLLIDHDTFDEHNLNRQNYSDTTVLGRYKVEVAKETIYKINPSIIVKTSKERFDGDFKLLRDYDIIIDALDDPKIKLLLAQQTKKYNKKFIHGAIGGFNIQITTNSTLEHIYRDDKKGAESILGNLSFIASLAASFQACEAVKTILNIGENLENQILIADLLDNEVFIV